MGRIDPVILRMRTDKADKYLFLFIFDDHDETVVIAFDIEYNPIICNQTGIPVDGFNFCRRAPARFYYLSIPGSQWLFGI
jgi:hypothetical protein